MPATRQIGKSNLAVQPLCLGGNVFGWTIDEPTSFRLLDAFVDAGLDFIDTADVYSKWVPGHAGGESETILGNWFKHSGKRDKVVIATKCGMDMGGDHKGLSRAWITAAVDHSLRRLRTDRIDLYQAHKDDPATPLEETMDAFGALVKAGKVRVLGASNYSADRLAAALEVSRAKGLPRYECLQPEYNLVERPRFEGPLEDLCLKEHIGVIPYYSLASGFLSGKYRSAADAGKSPRGAKATRYLDEKGTRVLAALDTAAAAHAATPAQVALAWLMARPSITAPIASATTPDQLTDLVAATKLTLTPTEITQLNAASA